MAIERRFQAYPRRGYAMEGVQSVRFARIPHAAAFCLLSHIFGMVRSHGGAAPEMLGDQPHVPIVGLGGLQPLSDEAEMCLRCARVSSCVRGTAKSLSESYLWLKWIGFRSFL